MCIYCMSVGHSTNTHTEKKVGGERDEKREGEQDRKKNKPIYWLDGSGWGMYSITVHDYLFVFILLVH